jgi:hypothetical protein
MADFLNFILFYFLVFSFLAPRGASHEKRLMTAVLFNALTMYLRASELPKRRDEYVLYSGVGYDRTFRKRSPGSILAIIFTPSIDILAYSYLNVSDSIGEIDSGAA